MITMGFVGNETQLGLEASGIVRRVGSGVSTLKQGDRVGILGSGLCRSRVVTKSNTCWKLPDSLSLDAAAATLVPCLTALYSLLHVGSLKKGQVSDTFTNKNISLLQLKKRANVNA